MFTGNLRTYPPFFQLAVFLGLWSILQLISFSLINVILTHVYGEAVVSSLMNQDLNSSNIEAFLMVNGINSFCSFILPPILFASLAMKNPMEYLDINSDRLPRIATVIMLALGVLCFIPALGSFINEFDYGAAVTANLESLRLRNALIFEDKSSQAFLRNLVIMAVIPAIGEELFFRGIVQRFAQTWLKKPFAAILFTGVFFSLIHFQITNFVPILLAGIILGYVYYLTGNLMLSILMHFIINGAQLFLNWKFADVGNGEMTRIILLVGGLALIAIFIKILLRQKTPLPQDWSVQEIPTLVIENDSE